MDSGCPARGHRADRKRGSLAGRAAVGACIGGLCALFHSAAAFHPGLELSLSTSVWPMGNRHGRGIDDLATRMARHVVLLRGINLVRRNRIAMPELRAALGADGFGDVMTYVQSGNVVLSSRASPERVAKRVNAVIKQRLGLEDRKSVV